MVELIARIQIFKKSSNGKHLGLSIITFWTFHLILMMYSRVNIRVNKISLLYLTNIWFALYSKFPNSTIRII